MGTSTSAAQLAKKMNTISTTIPRSTRKAVSDSALQGKNTVIRVAAQRGVSTSSRIAGGRWSVRYDLKGTARPTALLRIRGPFHLVESNTRAHPIPKPGRRRRNRKKAMSFNGIARTRVQHPGTTGKHIWRDAKKEIIGSTPPQVMRQVVLDMSQTLS